MIADNNTFLHFGQKAWFAAYTKSRAEKKVSLELEIRGFEHYLPLQRKLRQWSDRKKWVDFPLIPGYVFVYLHPSEFEKALRTNNLIGFLRVEGQPAIIPNTQIEALKRLLRQSEISYHVDHTLYKKGDEIEVIGGPLMGLRGHLVMVKGKKRVAVQLEQFNISVHVELPLEEIQKVVDI